MNKFNYDNIDIKTKINDLIKVLDLLKNNKNNLHYITRINSDCAEKCIIKNCNKKISYVDLINENYVCWYHAYEYIKKLN